MTEEDVRAFVREFQVDQVRFFFSSCEMTFVMMFERFFEIILAGMSPSKPRASHVVPQWFSTCARSRTTP